MRNASLPEKIELTILNLIIFKKLQVATELAQPLRHLQSYLKYVTVKSLSTQMKSQKAFHYFNQKISFEAGRIMLKRINELQQLMRILLLKLLCLQKDRSKIIEAKTKNYAVTPLFFWLQNIDLANERVKSRVTEGGHTRQTEVIK